MHRRRRSTELALYGLIIYTAVCADSAFANDCIWSHLSNVIELPVIYARLADRIHVNTVFSNHVLVINCNLVSDDDDTSIV